VPRLPLLAVASVTTMILTGCAGPAAAPTGAQAGDGALVAFYGDSYTLGTGATAPGRRWSTIVCAERGWREFNPSVNGLGFINHRTQFGDGSGDLPSLVLAQRPDIVFVTMGLNDNFSYDFAAGRIHDQIDADLARLAQGLPHARFLVVEPFWYTDTRPESLENISGWVEQAARSIHADYISGASHWIEGHPEWMAADGLHPNDDGYAEMARRMDAELAKLEL
jgi:lysophospholipase L1-like esterase